MAPIPGFIIAAAIGQSTAPLGPEKRLTFEVADIHPSPYGFGGRYFTVAPITGGLFVVHQATQLDLVSWAYGLERDAIAGGPPGLEFDRYEIMSKVPLGTTQAQARLMLQSLLADRFKLVVESGIKPLPALLLKVSRPSPRLKATANPKSDDGCQSHPAEPSSPNSPPGPTFIWNCSNMPMNLFSQLLGRITGLDHPVVDMTNLKGGWDFEFRYIWQGGQWAYVTDALDRLGLKLEAGTAPRQATVILSMAEAPTPNVANIGKLLPPLPPPSFDVAVIRPSQQESKNMQMRVTGADQVTFTGGTLLGMIGWAWKVSTTTVYGSPSFVDRQGWDITAKIPPPPAAPGVREGIDFEQVRLMLRSLLMERFGLKVHNEDRPADAYTLLAAAPKLKRADPANRSSCDGRPALGEKDPRTANPLLTRYIRCQNVTIDQFARELQRSSLDTMKNPAQNATELEGRYDITLSWTDAGTLASQPAAFGAAALPGENAGGSSGEQAGVPLSLQDAILKQLGLKLILQKRPIAVLVVDHLEQMPTPN